MDAVGSSPVPVLCILPSILLQCVAIWLQTGRSSWFVMLDHQSGVSSSPTANVLCYFAEIIRICAQFAIWMRCCRYRRNHQCTKSTSVQSSANSEIAGRILKIRARGDQTEKKMTRPPPKGRLHVACAPNSGIDALLLQRALYGYTTVFPWHQAVVLSVLCLCRQYSRCTCGLRWGPVQHPWRNDKTHQVNQRAIVGELGDRGANPQNKSARRSA